MIGLLPNIYPPIWVLTLVVGSAWGYLYRIYAIPATTYSVFFYLMVAGKTSRGGCLFIDYVGVELSLNPVVEPLYYKSG